MFPKTMTDDGHLLADDAVVLVKGRVDKRDDTPKLIAMEVAALRRRSSTAPRRCASRSRPDLLDEQRLGRLKALLSRAPGRVAGVPAPRRAQVLRLPASYCVEVGPPLVAELRVLLGPDVGPQLTVRAARNRPRRREPRPLKLHQSRPASGLVWSITTAPGSSKPPDGDRGRDQGLHRPRRRRAGRDGRHLRRERPPVRGRAALEAGRGVGAHHPGA